MSWDSDRRRKGMRSLFSSKKMPETDLRAKISVLKSVEFTELFVVYLYPNLFLDAAPSHAPGLLRSKSSWALL